MSVTFLRSLRTCGALLTAAACLAVVGVLPAADEELRDASASPAGENAPNAAAQEFFEKRVRPLLAQHCYECHSSKTGPENGELVLDTLEGIRAGGSRGPLLKPRQPESSLILHAIRYADADLEMPPDGKLSAAEQQVIQTWIELGGVIPHDTPGRKSSPRTVDLEQEREFWSFRPLQPAIVPRITDTSVPLDAFLQQRLVEQGLSFSPPASRRTLIRRATFDLIGLPPTPEEVEAFLADQRPDAFERLVDRLLESPHYGERWGRFWLDLARYADAGEGWLKSIAQAWRYRDWVVDAFNRNLPYDVFVKLQLAADLQPDTGLEDLPALGFLGLSPTYWKELKLAPPVIEQIVADEWDERVDTVTKTFLGLTVACARCHDHKFDPVTMEDYYALAGVFASTSLEDRPWLPDPQAGRIREARQQVDKLTEALQKIKDKSSPEAQELQSQIDAVRQATPDFDAPWIHIVKEASVYVVPDGADATRLDYRADQPRDLPVFRRGNPSNPGESPVPRRFLSILSSENSARFHEGSGRRELADALFAEAAPLTARVIVNRIWAQHFGTGLVRTTSDFGHQGEPPSHPQLLDALATRLIAQGWNLKWLHREILLSRAYQQSSADNAHAQQIDPENRLLWRMSRRRLDVEMWRDAMLAASGELDCQLGGPATSLEESSHVRRTLYGKVERPDLSLLLRLYDFPEATAHSPQRIETVTPLQQLYVLNGEFTQQRAEHLVSRLPQAASTEDRVSRLYQWLYSRPPTPRECELGCSFLAAGSGSAQPDQQRWVAYAHVLLSANEFLFVD